MLLIWPLSAANAVTTGIVYKVLYIFGLCRSGGTQIWHGTMDGNDGKWTVIVRCLLHRCCLSVSLSIFPVRPIVSKMKPF